MSVDYRSMNRRESFLKTVIIGKTNYAINRLCTFCILKQFLLNCFVDMKAGDRVSVYADVNGKCLRGLVKPFDGETLFVGNGIVQYSREDIYCSRDPLRLGLLCLMPLSTIFQLYSGGFSVNLSLFISVSPDSSGSPTYHCLPVKNVIFCWFSGNFYFFSVVIDMEQEKGRWNRKRYYWYNSCQLSNPFQFITSISQRNRPI
jgi:hypothetical protein